MKKFLLTIIFALTALICVAETVQIPVTLQNDRFSSGNSRLFSIIMPLAPGALKDVKNLQISDADGVEIASQSEVISRYASGDISWVRICGLINMGRVRSRKIFVEYGSDVLNSAKRGIVLAETGGRMLVDAGVLSAEFDLGKFALPEKISVKGKESGGFAPLIFAGHRPRFTVIEPGPWHLVLAMDVPGKPECGTYRLHFYNDLPELRIEYYPGRSSGKAQISFINREKFSFAEADSGKVMHFDFSGRKAVVMPILTGIVPRWHLERAGVVAAPGEMIPALRNLEKELIADVKKFPAKHRPGTLLEAFLRTGDPVLLRHALKSKPPEFPVLPDDSWRRAVLAAYKDIPEPGVVSGESRFEPDSAEYLICQLFKTPVVKWDERNIRYAELLASAFDSNTGGWFRRIGEKGSRAYLLSQWRIPALLLMMQLERVSGSGKIADIVDTGMRRVIFDGIAGGVRSSSQIFDLLAGAADFYRRHPERIYNMDKKSIRQTFAGANRSPLRFRMFPGMSVNIAARSGGAVTVAECDTDGNLGVLDTAGNQLQFSGSRPHRQFTVPVTGAVLTGNDRSAVDCVLKFSGRYRAGFAIADFPLELKTAQFLKFDLTLPADRRHAELRVLPQMKGETAEIYAVSPQKEEFCHRVSGGDLAALSSAVPLVLKSTGRWQIFVHVTCGGAALALDGSSGKLSR